MKSYIEFSIQSPTYEHLEIIVALLSEFPINSFQELEDNTLVATIPIDLWNEKMEQEIKTQIKPFGSFKDIHEIKDTNWNKKWEENFDPVEIDNFCRIYATFHKFIPGFDYNIKIMPKMAFGTGHHATTQMMVKLMSTLDLGGENVLDFGCGTGVLAILASMMGASKVIGIDNDPLALDNSDYNAKLNGIKNITFTLHSLDELMDAGHSFGVILANIQLDVLSQHVLQIKQLLSSNGYVLLSGVLETFKSELEKSYLSEGFQLKATISKGDWICQLYTFNNNNIGH